MKSRILHKNNQNLFLGIIAVSALAFTSCSRSLTSFQNTKELQNEQVLTNPASICEKQAATSHQAENKTLAFVPVSKNIENEAALVAHQPKSNTSFRKKASMLLIKTAMVKNQVLNKVQNQVEGIQGLPTNNSVASYKHTTRPAFGVVRRGIALIVVAIILYLIAYLLFFAGPLSYLFYVIATICLVVGLLDLLFGLMRSSM